VSYSRADIVTAILFFRRGGSEKVGKRPVTLVYVSVGRE
jgi:hypothetical protein